MDTMETLSLSGACQDILAARETVNTEATNIFHLSQNLKKCFQDKDCFFLMLGLLYMATCQDSDFCSFWSPFLFAQDPALPRELAGDDGHDSDASGLQDWCGGHI
jgi:hypothetical protein